MLGSNRSMVRYKLDEHGRELILSDEVLETFKKYRQKGGNAKEAGGQLFASFVDGNVIVLKATEPHRLDRRGRFFFLPSRFREQKEINTYYKVGLHFIGDWHTHPQATPQPYNDDKNSMREVFQRSIHELKAMVLVIVGQREQPDGLWVSLHDGNKGKRLNIVLDNKS